MKRPQFAWAAPNALVEVKFYLPGERDGLVLQRARLTGLDPDAVMWVCEPLAIRAVRREGDWLAGYLQVCPSDFELRPPLEPLTAVLVSHSAYPHKGLRRLGFEPERSSLLEDFLSGARW